MDSDRAFCLSAVGVCEAGADPRHGALLPGKRPSRLAATGGDSRRVDAPGTIADFEATRSRQRIEFHGRVCRDAAHGGDAVSGVGRHSLFSLMLFPFAWEVMWGSCTIISTAAHHGVRRSKLRPGRQGISRVAVTDCDRRRRIDGQGLYGGTQSQLKFLPEGHTDFVFSVFAEEWGFLGVLILLLLFVALIWLSLEIATRAKDELGALLAVGVISMLCFCVVVNIGMTGGHVSDRRHSPSAHELRRQRDHHDDGLARVAAERETAAIELVFIEMDGGP